MEIRPILVCLLLASRARGFSVTNPTSVTTPTSQENNGASSTIVPDDTPTTSSESTATAAYEREVIEPDTIAWALAPPIIGFFLWGTISRGVAFYIDQWNNFQIIDGNRLAADVLRPTVNGIVVPAASIVLGTLFATTINVLWNRQLQIRSSINKEVGEIRLLRRAIFGCFGTAQHSKRRAAAFEMIRNYVRTLTLETQTDCIPALKEIQEKRGISVNEMEELADMLHGVDGAASSRQSSVATAESLLVSLNSHRSERVATTLTNFPTIHWILLMFLYSSIQMTFFIDSNQGVLQYLNSLQLRVLFSILLGVGSGSAVLLKGLNDPFQGLFSIRLAALQLEYLDELVESDIAAAEMESGPSALVSMDRNQDRPNYNTRNTLFFHLFTGPWASSVKIIGEVVTWTVRKLTKLWAMVVRPWQRKNGD